jgi:hypothetical protein
MQPAALHRDGRYPALSMDGGRFLAHLHRAAMRRSPKISALVVDLREVGLYVLHSVYP